MDGLIILNKPLNISSHDAVFKVRKILKEKKVGHTGTLDPLASGILVLCIGGATKLCQYLTTDIKEYRAKITLGFSTKTYDLEGEVVDTLDKVNVTLEEIDKVADSFLGKSLQYPPIYSAIKKDGKKLYEYALKNEEVEIPSRMIEVYKAKRVSDLIKEDGKVSFYIDFKVSKGTYIRSIANDFGKKMNIPSVLAGLERVECGMFTIEDSFTIEDIEQGNYQIISMIEAVKEFFKVNDEESIMKAKNGMKISYRFVKEKYGDTPDKIAIVDESLNKLVAIYTLFFNEEIKKYYYKAETVWN